MEDIQDQGIVTEVTGNRVTVEIKRGGGCKSCSMRGFCFSKSTPAVFHLESDIPLIKGDLVELEISPSGRVLASMLIFGLPVLALVAGYLIAQLWLSELSGIIVAFAAMAGSFVLIRFCDRHWGKKLEVRIARKI